jgi:outer membrane receptor for ferrienterochelin and colicins
MSFPKKATLCCISTIQILAVSAQPMPDDRGGSETPQLEVVTVTARRAIEQRFLSAGSLVVVDRKDIEQLGAFSIAEVLRQLPGVQVTPAADGGVEIRMRGMDRNATQLLVDGQRVSSGKTQLPIDQLPPELIERIEVVRAPTAEFTGATGGTINIVLRQATAQRETTIRLTDNHVWGRNAGQAFFSKTGPLGGQSRASPPTSATSDGVLPEAEVEDQPWSYFLALSSTGYVLGSNTHRTTMTHGEQTSDADISARYRRSEISIVPRVQGRLSATDQLALRATLSRTHFSGRYDLQGSGLESGSAFDNVASEFYGYEKHYWQTGADWTHNFKGSKLETALSSSQARDNVNRIGNLSQRYATAPAQNASYVFGDRREETVQSLSTKWTGTTDSLLWVVGAQMERRRLDVDTQGSGGISLPSNLSLGASTTRQILWGQNEWELPVNTTLTTGLRAETLLIESNAPGLLSIRRKSFLQPSLHARTPMGDDLQFRANIARVTRNPSLWDLVDRTVPSQTVNNIISPDTLGNPMLRPEVSWTLDVGFERRLAPQGQVGMNLFVRQVKDTIAPLVSLVGSRWVEQRSNVGDATIWGLEADLKTGLTWLGLARDWTLSANASLLQSRMASGLNEGNRIPGQARYVASMNVAKPLRRTGGLFGGATLQFTGRAQLNTSPGITGQDHSRATLDLYIGSVLPQLGYWRMGVYNIGNARYLRNRTYGDVGGAPVQSDSSMTLTPRLFLTIGTQF